MSDDYKIEDKSYPIRKFGPNSKWKTVTVSVEEWDKLMTVVEAVKEMRMADAIAGVRALDK